MNKAEFVDSLRATARKLEVSFEHFEKDVMPYGRIDAADFPDEPTLVYAADLVEQDTSILPLEYELGTAAEGLSLAGKRRYDNARQFLVHVVGRYHERRPGFVDFASEGRIKVDPPDISPIYQTHSSVPSSGGIASHSSGSSFSATKESNQ